MSDQHNHNHGNTCNCGQNHLPPVRLSFVIDGMVVYNINVDDRTAAIFMSDPKIIETTGQDIKEQDLYDESTGKFKRFNFE
jgi:hypothetical protein